MSGLYIPGINLPRAEDDWTLELFVDSNGEVEAHTVTGIRTLKAIELPPHGRLIDADAFLARNAYFADREFVNPKYDDTLKDLIDRADTIIPADGGDT